MLRPGLFHHEPLIVPGRRRFVQGLAAAGALAGFGAPHLAWGTQAQAVCGTPPILRGNTFDLVVDSAWVNFSGRSGLASTINGSLPAPTLRWREGEEVTIRVTNRLQESTSLHWHGILLPYQMDGVPGISFTGIAPGETFTYRFKVRQSGTYWYHSHSGFQELMGMYGAIIIDPAQQAGPGVERDHVLVFSDWSDEDPMRMLAKLKSQGHYYNVNQPTVLDFMRDASREGLGSAMSRRQMWNEMRMKPTDLADVSAQTLTYLINGMPAAANWTALFQRGERVKLRMINASGHTFYDVRIPGLKLRVVQVDGVDAEPVSVDEFRFGPGETLDVVVAPQDDAYTIFAQSMDRTGYVRATLAVREGLQAPVPTPDAVQWLSMADMMGGMTHGEAGGHQAHGNHGSHGDHMAHAGHGGHAGHGAHGQLAKGGGAASTAVARHASTEFGPSTDMRVDVARTNLDDPGVGLRSNGRRVLTLADLRTPSGPLDAREPTRDIELHLTGNMERYSWSLDGLEFGQSTPVHFPYGERLRVILHNDTMMTHPMHLHGMWSELESPDGQFLSRRHTLPVQPAQRISFQVTADALGRWAWHCHLMFHMDAGMFREVVVS